MIIVLFEVIHVKTYGQSKLSRYKENQIHCLQVTVNCYLIMEIPHILWVNKHIFRENQRLWLSYVPWWRCSRRFSVKFVISPKLFEI